MNDVRLRPIEIYKEAWQVIKEDYLMNFIIVLVGVMAANFVPVIIFGPMMCGVFYVLLKRYDRRQVAFDDLFAGTKMDVLLPAFLVGLVFTLPAFILIVLVYAPLVIAVFSGGIMSQSEFYSYIAGVLIAEVIIAFAMVCLHSLLMFAFPLIIDRKYSAWQAMRTSAATSWRNIGAITGLYAVGFVVALAGMLVFCIGVYLVLPIIFMSMTIAYRRLFPLDPNAATS